MVIIKNLIDCFSLWDGKIERVGGRFIVEKADVVILLRSQQSFVIWISQYL